MWRDEAWLYDMWRSACLITESYTPGFDRELFGHVVSVQDQVIRRLIIIGEAAKNVSGEYRTAHPEIPWRRLAGMRDVLVHQYFRLDLDLVWDIGEEELPALIAAVQPLISPPEEE
jgi:uncharacterized protein with HEPN domain